MTPSSPTPELPARTVPSVKERILRAPAAIPSPGLPQFLAVTVQFALIAFLFQYWQIESVAFTQVLPAVLVLFIVHHWLPQRLRLPFFALASIGITIMVVGQIGPETWRGVLTGRIAASAFAYRLLPGATLVAIGLVIAGICHLPIRWAWRWLLLGGTGASLAVVRAQTGWLPDLHAIWPVLGSMFALRVIAYCYELRHRTAEFSSARTASYFFMLPNVCFPLFPVVDYKTFQTTYYNQDWPRIYQSGLQWMLRGALHLLLYKVVYHFFPLDVSHIDTGLGVAGCILGTYLLYLHVSGQFHLIVGLLHMFGFNLPETHHLFFLSSSFSDFWRRINIYWKDFMMKVFFYPIFFRLRRAGTLKAIGFATLATFFLTWLLHAWQWFWIRGTFLHTWQDISFWTILALLVFGNALAEAKSSKRRTLSPARVHYRERAVHGLKTAGTFLTISLLWTLWSSQSADELLALADTARSTTVVEWMVIVGVLAGIGVAGAIFGYSVRETSEGRQKQPLPPFRFWRAATISLSMATGLILLASPVAGRLFNPLVAVVERVRGNDLNARDFAQQRRGYYEELDVARGGGDWQRQKVDEPEGWRDGSDELYVVREDFLLRDVRSGVTTNFRGAPATTNSLGMRDREYTPQKPANTFRFLMVGASHALGAGVNDDQTFESLLESRLNATESGHGRRFEILNMAVGGDSILQKLYRLEQSRTLYNPDAVLYVIHSAEHEFLGRHLRQLLIKGIPAPAGYSEYLQDLIQATGLTGKMDWAMVHRRLRPAIPQVYEWTFRRLAALQQSGVKVWVVYRPAPVDIDGIEVSEREKLLRAANLAGLEVADLTPAFLPVADRNRLILGKWDHHTSAYGHELLANALYEQLEPTIRNPLQP